MEPSFLRLFRFRPVAAGFDTTLRSVLVPDLLRLPGIRGVFAGRIGPEEEGGRLVATLWDSAPAMAAAVGRDFEPPVFHPELLDATTDRRLDLLPIVVAFPPTCPADVGILRLVEGRTRPGMLDRYVDAAREGTRIDRETAAGPQALYLAAEPPDRFATLSLWDSWAHVEAATGADARRADRTRHAEHLASWSADHYEVVSGAAVTIVGESAESAESAEPAEPAERAERAEPAEPAEPAERRA